MYIVGLPYDGLPFAPQRKVLSFPGDGLTFYSNQDLSDVMLVNCIHPETRPLNCSRNPDDSHRSGRFTYYNILIVPSNSYFCSYDGPDIQDFPVHAVSIIDWNRKTIMRLIKALEGSVNKVTTTQAAQPCVTA